MGYMCDTHPDVPAVLLITQLETGDTTTICGPDVHIWAQAIADATAPEDFAASDAITVDPTTGDVTDDDEGEPDPATPTVAPVEPDPTPEPTPEPEPTETPEAVAV